MEERAQWLKWAADLQSLAQAGLYYGKDPFDRERYGRIREIAAEMVSAGTGLPVERVRDLFCNEIGYQTPKLDTRGAVFRDGKILLVRERSGKWSIPGGWCDYDLSPAENTVKEVKEEAGLDCAVKKVIAVQDRIKHNQPAYPYGVVKIFYLCEAYGGAFAANIETSERGYFDEDSLPPMAEEKCTAEQVRLCFAAYRAENWETQFD